jgi:hypothetical protein
MNPLPSHSERKLPGRHAWIKRSAIIILPLLCLLVFGSLIGVRLVGSATNAGAASLVPIKGHVPGLVKKSTLLGATDTSQSLSLSIGLQLRNAANLKSYVDNMSRQDSPASQHLTPAEIAAAYAPLSSSQQAIITYLQIYGFTVTLTLSQHLVIGVQGTVGDADNAFHLQINNYKTADGKTFYAPSSEPLVPGNLAALIQTISGLDNSVTFTHPPTKPRSQSTANATSSSVQCIPANDGPYVASEIASVYNLNGFYSAGLQGQGQTVGLIEFDDYKASDISTYTHCYGGGSVPIHKELVDGGTKQAPGAGAFEVEMDMQLILSATPKLASLDVYEAPNTDQGSNDMWAQIINNDSISVISTSWGDCEADMPSADLNEENSLFTLAAAQGQTIFAASGDNGTDGCAPDGGTGLAVIDPASQPYVTGVGGTTLTTSGRTTYSSETVWHQGLQNLDGSSGGGLSTVWPIPSWQQGPGVSNGFSNGMREVPDVAMDADPASGYLIYCTVAATGCTGGSWWYGGGTSAGAPMWAAFMALTDELSLKDGGFNLGLINPLLYQIDQNATSYGVDFHDVTTGNNDTLDGGNTYPATANYDMASGLGSYNAWSLGQDLVNLGLANSGSRGAPANTTWYFAEGSVGNSFQEYLTILNPGTQTATVTVQYLFQNRAAVTKVHTVAASSRSTINVNSDLGIATSASQQAISAIVTSTQPVVAERPMYFDWNNIRSGTDVVGATDASNTSFYFAQGDTTHNGSESSSEFVTILNPSTTQTANVTANYYSGGQIVRTSSVSIAPLHRGTISNGYLGKAAIAVTSDSGVVVERPIYFNDNIPTAGGWTTGAASTVGATSLNNNWYFAEGHTANSFQEYLVLANFTASDAQATINLEYTNGSVQQVIVTVPAQSQYYFDVNNAYLHPLSGCSCTPTADVSAEVTTSTNAIVAERVMYFHYQNADSGGTDIVGTPQPASTYSFAEGYTNNSFNEWLTLQNPNNAAETVAVTLFVDNTIVQKDVKLPAFSRTTLNINSIVVPIAQAYPDIAGQDGYAVSIDVQVLGSGTVVAERPEYFKYNGDPGGTDVIGYTGN